MSFALCFTDYCWPGAHSRALASGCRCLKRTWLHRGYPFKSVAFLHSMNDDVLLWPSKTQQSFMSWLERSLCVAGSRSWRCCDQAWASRKVRDSGAQQWSCLIMLWATQTIHIYTHTCREGRPIITNLKPKMKRMDASHCIKRLQLHEQKSWTPLTFWKLFLVLY